jgi:hypothetical protein
MDVTATKILPADLRHPDSRDLIVGSIGGWLQCRNGGIRGCRWALAPTTADHRTAIVEVIHMCSTPKAKETEMRNPLGWLLTPVAELLDRSLFTVPDVDMTMAATAGSATALSTERQIPRTTKRW